MIADENMEAIGKASKKIMDILNDPNTNALVFSEELGLTFMKYVKIKEIE